ncbi:asparaginase [Synergistaceae bacterium OttesenSCG-928-I11]|nr:asparaginase [Synergistaceae bacterium OttesenSCG-928-I11]
MSEIIVHVTRGGRVESMHRGDVAVVDGEGRVKASLGDPARETYFRSAAKPLQALNVIFSGAADRFGLTQDELAVTCGSHYAEDFHRAAVTSILRKAGIPVEKLKSPPGPSIKYSLALKQAASGRTLDAVDSNCSGKHSGMLAACVAKGYPLDGYMEPDHPVQRDIVAILAEMCGVPADAIGIGEDGCGVPVHYMPLSAMARGYARLATPVGLPEDWRSACARVCDAMNAHPEMVAGTGGFCTELMRHTDGRFVAKIGAEAVYCVGVVGRDMGIALKVDDGNGNRPIPVTVMHILKQLGLFPDGVPEGLLRFARPQVKNDHGHIAGDLRPVFSLDAR